MFKGRKLLTCAFAGIVGGMVSMPAMAQDGPNTGAIGLEAGVEFTNQYWFRGIAQENEGLIWQPYVDVSVGITDNFSVYFGNWNSVHDEEAPTGGWYEADVYVGGSYTMDKFTFDLAYINLHSPDNGGSFAEEIDFSVGYDDSDLWGDSGVPALSPYILVAFEIDAGSDGLGVGGDEGVYLELGIEPTFAIMESETYPVTLAVPVTLGFDLDDYYENGVGEDDGFGFAQIGLVFSVPLDELVPAEYGSWSAWAGAHFLLNGDATAEISEVDFGVVDDGDFAVWGTFGVGFEY